jgi:hypothetical protein
MTENKQTAVGTSISKIQQYYSNEMKNLQASLSDHSIKPDEEQINCVSSLLAAMQELCDKEGVTIKEIDQTNIMTILEQCAMLRLNVAAVPRECYIIIRNQKVGKSNEEKWVKKFEFGVEGDGNDKIVRKYGVNVKKIYPYWIVREGDGFTYPSFKGLAMEPPTWSPKGGNGKVLRVVYPIEYEDGTVQYHISERADTAINLKAHILNTVKMSKSITDTKKNEIKDKLQNMNLDQLFADKEMLDIMSPAWRESHSRESMLLRKMRNNALKPIPRDFGNAYIATAYTSTIEDKVIQDEEIQDPESVIDAEVSENAGTEELKALPEESSTEKIEIDKFTGEVKEKAAVKKNRPF